MLKPPRQLQGSAGVVGCVCKSTQRVVMVLPNSVRADRWIVTHIDQCVVPVLVEVVESKSLPDLALRLDKGPADCGNGPSCVMSLQGQIGLMRSVSDLEYLRCCFLGIIEPAARDIEEPGADQRRHHIRRLLELSGKLPCSLVDGLDLGAVQPLTSMRAGPRLVNIFSSFSARARPSGCASNKSRAVYILTRKSFLPEASLPLSRKIEWWAMFRPPRSAWRRCASSRS